MKKSIKSIFYFLSLMLIFSNSILSDSKFGLKAGGTYSNFIQNDRFNTQKLGMTMGVFIENKLSRHLFMQVECNILQKGAIENILSDSIVPNHNGSFGNREKTIENIYIEIPLILRIRPFSFISLYAGGYMSFLLYSKTVININNQLEIKDTKETYEDVGSGLILGAALHFDHGYFVEGRAILDQKEIIRETEIKNQTYSVGFGKRF